MLDTGGRQRACPPTQPERQARHGFEGERERDQSEADQRPTRVTGASEPECEKPQPEERVGCGAEHDDDRADGGDRVA